MLNLLEIRSGQIIRLKNGGTAEVIENVGDGIWLNVRLPTGEEELLFCEEIAGIEERQAQ
ncbi:MULTISPECIES: hypothetical protein [unclassified Variovorax]|jgi:hypothetical protein|uniref:hypothetical protein n=1 Tax=unclassified Variovorax TaxID=663243 RepID=UPI00086AA678|nr:MULTISPECIES: hypothetical protein [unclassified Variovorax]MBN8758477.1 hypothetical protein [Variovorax sp.]ODU18866.1 MAG: hypothetical protein ABS94_02700 [Variovorax sp. SCN 67-85]ODV18302.1 MAG: hypothetical protein ABT25_28215 [Variovorax sp. SCN 67-20]OJZ05849.1 MAG: hypothetical protein BGP22_22345 [Variovorax sp. 67-131]